MKCPKCGYQSFNNLAACKKCGRDLTQEQQKLNLGNPVVVPLPDKSPGEPPPAATEEPIAAASKPVAIEKNNSLEDDHVLDDFFQSIESFDQDQVPSALPLNKQPAAHTSKNSRAKRQTAADGPQWSQEPPQGDFPFDELDSDLDALRLSRAAESTADEVSPFDDVDTFEINWQSPLDEEDIAETEPVAVSEPAREQPSKKEEWDLRGEVPATTEPVVEQTEPAPAARTTEPELEPIEAEEPVIPPPSEQPSDDEEWYPRGEVPATTEPVVEQTEPAPAARTTEPELEPIEAEEPVIPPRSEQPSDAEEWPLPDLPTDQKVEGFFALEEPCEPKPPTADAAPPSEPASPPSIEVQEELPLAAREIETPSDSANIAAIFLPGSEQISIDNGVQLLIRRAKAYLLDLGLLTVIFALFVCAGEIARSPAVGERFRFTSDVLLDLATPYFLVFFALCFGYFTLFHYLSGQTPGKMLCNVRVEGDDHAGLTLSQAFLRCVGGLISLLPAGLGFLSIVLNGEQRGWNDQLAGCRVVMLEELAED